MTRQCLNTADVVKLNISALWGDIVDDVQGTSRTLKYRNKFAQLPKRSRQKYLVDPVNSIYLSQREIQTLLWFLKGKRTKEVARIQNISYRTVEVHTLAIRKKFGNCRKKELVDRLAKTDISERFEFLLDIDE